MRGVREKVDKAYGTDSMGIFQTKTKLRGMQKTSPNGAQSISGGSYRVPLLDSTLDISQKLVCLGYPNGIASKCFCQYSPLFSWPSNLSLQGQRQIYPLGMGWLRVSYCNQFISKPGSYRKKYQVGAEKTLSSNQYSVGAMPNSWWAKEYWAWNTCF